MKVVLAVLLAMASFNLHAGLFGPSNYWECILDNMPGAKNDSVAWQVYTMCVQKFPNPRDIEEKDKAGGLISVPRAGDCVLKNAKDTFGYVGPQLIVVACHQLYRE